jgi:hypothetical protein
MEGEEEYADPNRKKRTRKGKREIFSILLFIIGIIKESISLGLSMKQCSPSGKNILPGLLFNGFG